MKRWSWHRTRVLLLAVFLGLGISLSFVQGSVMAVAMSVATAHHGSSGCDGCGGGDHSDMNAGTCLAMCGPVAQGLLPGELLTLPSASRMGLSVARLHLGGQFHSPDHGPPKILTLG
jgi:hypothetical protein